jgi:tellurite methyltransferase
MAKPYDKDYSKKELLWGSEPSVVAKEILKHRKKGLVLDVGMGEGRDVLFLAEKGFQVTGVDLSEIAVNKCLKLAKEKKLSVEALVGDFLDYYPNNRFDIIISNSTLHLMEKDSVRRAVVRMKKMTRKNGLNIIAVFTEEDASDVTYKFKKDELKLFYKDWKILDYKEFSTPLEKHGSGDSHKHEMAIIVAEKAKS